MERWFSKNEWSDIDFNCFKWQIDFKTLQIKCNFHQSRTNSNRVVGLCSHAKKCIFDMQNILSSTPKLEGRLLLVVMVEAIGKPNLITFAICYWSNPLLTGQKCSMSRWQELTLLGIPCTNNWNSKLFSKQKYWKTILRSFMGWTGLAVKALPSLADLLHRKQRRGNKHTFKVNQWPGAPEKGWRFLKVLEN